jgi:hypothetical protein
LSQTTTMKYSYLLPLLLLTAINTNAQTFPGNDVIGKGYDVFGEFANNKSILRYEIFDFSKLPVDSNENGYNTPKIVSIDNISEHLTRSIEGTSKKEYITNLSKDIGLGIDIFFFKTSFDRNFSTTVSNSETAHYYTYMDINTKWRVNIDNRDPEYLNQYLNAQFKKDLLSMNPEKFFQYYGTHYISSAFLGGRIDYSSTTIINETVTTEKVKKAIGAKVKAINGGNKIGDENIDILDNSVKNVRQNIVGGDSEMANDIRDYEQYKKWAQSMKSNPVLCGFDKQSLQPIWSLCIDEKRRLELRDYFNNSIVPNHPLPKHFEYDETLDGTEIIKTYRLFTAGFRVIEDCDPGTLFTVDEAGDFTYNIAVAVNGKVVQKTFTTQSEEAKVWSGEMLKVDKSLVFEIPYNSESKFTIYFEITDDDEYTDSDILSRKTQIDYPFNYEKLYNHYSKDSTLFIKEPLKLLQYEGVECRADVYYRLGPESNKTAVEFGNKGWEEFEKGNFNECLNYSREGLKLDNSLDYIHYNVALVYLIQGHPRAFEKYKNTSEIFKFNKEGIKYALEDIENYENANGLISNSEKVKILLQSRI